MTARLALLLAPILLAACLEASTHHCGDGTICPGKLTCAPQDSDFRCVDPGLIEACRGREAGETCDFGGSGDSEGRCRDGVCVLAGCGDDVLAVGEVCEPIFYQDDPDRSCRVDCLKIEECDDGIVDPGRGENCDDQNQNPGDGCDHCALTEWVPVEPTGAPVDVTALVASPSGIAIDGNNSRIYVSDAANNQIHRIDMVDPDKPATWTVQVLAGLAGPDGYGFADGVLADARFRDPAGLYLDGDRLYVADSGNHVIRQIDLVGEKVTTFAGTPATYGFYEEPDPDKPATAATEALLYRPMGITRCYSSGGARDGSFFIADTGNNRVRRVQAKGDGWVIRTVLGDGVAASSGQGAPAREFPVNQPASVDCDVHGNLVVTSTDALRLVAASDDKVVDGTLGVSSIFQSAGCISSVEFVADGTLRLVDPCMDEIVELERVVAEL